MGSSVRCKVKCTDVLPEKDEPDGPVAREKVKFEAVTADGDGENAEWSKYTPTANFYMAITNEAAFGKFEQGKEYYVDFTPA